MIYSIFILERLLVEDPFFFVRFFFKSTTELLRQLPLINLNKFYFKNSTLTDRMASYDTSPGTSLGFHWLFGMLFIFYFYTFFLFTKEVLRPGLSKSLKKV